MNRPLVLACLGLVYGALHAEPEPLDKVAAAEPRLTSRAVAQLKESLEDLGNRVFKRREPSADIEAWAHPANAPRPSATAEPSPAASGAPVVVSGAKAESRLWSWRLGDVLAWRVVGPVVKASPDQMAKRDQQLAIITPKLGVELPALPKPEGSVDKDADNAIDFLKTSMLGQLASRLSEKHGPDHAMLFVISTTLNLPYVDYTNARPQLIKIYRGFLGKTGLPDDLLTPLIDALEKIDKGGEFIKSSEPQIKRIDAYLTSKVTN